MDIPQKIAKQVEQLPPAMQEEVLRFVVSHHRRGADWREGRGFAAILRQSRFDFGSGDE